MSLRLRGDLGKYQAATGNSSLGISQTQFTAGLWVKANSATAVNASLMGMVAAPLGNAFGVTLNSTSIGITLRGANGSLGYGSPTILGRWVFVCLRLDATGTSTIAIDGIVKASKANIGVTQGGINQIYIGPNATGAYDALIDAVAFWNGLYLPDDDVDNWRDGLATPETTSTPATSYYVFNGTPGTNPTAADAAMHDLIGSNDFVTMPGTGGVSTNAVYDASVPSFTAAIVATMQIGRGGGILAHLTTNPAFGPVTPAYVTAVTGKPSFSLNGSPILVSNPIWDSVDKRAPFVGYAPYTAGSPPTPIIIAPTDVITYTTPSNWVAASQGIAAAESGTAGNYVDGYEPGLSGYPSFDPTAYPHTFRPGIGGGGENRGVTCISKNVFHCTLKPWTGALTSDATGYPLTCAAGGTVSANTWSISVSYANGVDGSRFPIPWGVWTQIADEKRPSTPATATATVSSSTVIRPDLITGPVITPGTIDTNPLSPTFGWELNKQWDWTVIKGVAGSFACSLNMAWKMAAGVTEVTIKNAKLFSPGETPVTTIDSDEDYNESAFPQFGFSPTVAVGFSRNLCYSYPSPSIVDADDLPERDRFSYGPDPIAAANVWPVSDPTLTGNRNIPIRAVQFYDTAATPYVYTPVKWNNNFIVDGVLSQYKIKLSDHGLDNSWLFHGSGTTRNVICQYACGLSDGTPVPHNLKSGQFVTMGTFTVNCQNAHGTGVCSVGGTACVWVTSATTFITYEDSNLVADSLPGQIVGSQIVNKTAGFLLQPGVGTNVEQLGAIANAPGNPGIGLCITHCMSDEGVTSFAQRCRATIPTGTIVSLQWSNEIYINNFLTQFAQELSNLVGGTQENITPQVMKRMGETFDIFETVWGADSGSLRRLIQPWTVGPNITLSMLTYCQANQIKVDGITIAPYENISYAPSYLMAAAQLVADSVDSIAHTAGPGGTQLSVLPFPQYIDFARHWFKYGKLWNGPTGFVQQHVNSAISSGYGQGSGGFFYAFPKIYIYEGGPSVLIPPGVSLNNSKVRSWLSHDVMYHPSWYDLQIAFYGHHQCPGPAGTIGFYSGGYTSSITPRSFALGPQFICTDGKNDGTSAECWCNAGTFQTQPGGYGLSNQFASPTAAIGGDGLSHDIDNETVSLQALTDWLTGSAPPPTPSFFVNPSVVQDSTPAPQLLTLSGVNTTWVSGSTVSVTNSLSGTTTVTAGTWTALSNTSATLGVTTGAGAGTWDLTIDGVPSPTLAVTGVIPPVLPSKGRAWIGALSRPRK